MKVCSRLTNAHEWCFKLPASISRDKLLSAFETCTVRSTLGSRRIVVKFFAKI